MKIGIVSDLHRHLPLFVERAFEDVDRIICAGDAQDERLLWKLQTIAPVTGVRGNCDLMLDLPFSVTTEIDGIPFFIVHRPEDVGLPAPEIQVVVHGHTHVPRDEEINGVRYLNPGSATDPRRGSNASCMVIETKDGKLTSVELIERQ